MSDTPKRNEAVARWNMELRSGCLSIELESDGQWVDYDDHERAVRELAADRDSWRDQASERVKDWDEMRQKADALQGEVSRLREALAALRLAAYEAERRLSYLVTKNGLKIDADLVEQLRKALNLEPPTDGRLDQEAARECGAAEYRADRTPLHAPDVRHRHAHERGLSALHMARDTLPGL